MSDLFRIFKSQIENTCHSTFNHNMLKATNEVQNRAILNLLGVFQSRVPIDDRYLIKSRFRQRKNNYIIASSNFELFSERPLDFNGNLEHSIRIVSYYGQKPVEVEMCHFYKCYAFGSILTSCSGGAIHAYNNSLGTKNCIFEECQAKYAGAIAAGKDKFEIEHCSFVGNKATDSIGAVWSMSAINAKVTDSNFSYNVAVKEVGAMDFNCSNPTVSRCYFTQSIIDSNVSQLAFTCDDSIKMSDCYFKDESKAAYMIYFESKSMELMMTPYLHNVFFDCPIGGYISGEGNVYVYFSGYYCSSGKEFTLNQADGSIVVSNLKVLIQQSLDSCIEYYSTPNPTKSFSPVPSKSMTPSTSPSCSSSLSPSSSPMRSLSPSVSKPPPATFSYSPSSSYSFTQSQSPSDVSSPSDTASHTPSESPSIGSSDLQEDKEVNAPSLAAGLGGSLLLLLILIVALYCFCRKKKERRGCCFCCKKKEEVSVDISLKVPIHNEDFELKYPYSLDDDPPWVAFLSPMWRGGYSSEELEYTSESNSD